MKYKTKGWMLEVNNYDAWETFKSFGYYGESNDNCGLTCLAGGDEMLKNKFIPALFISIALGALTGFALVWFIDFCAVSDCVLKD